MGLYGLSKTPPEISSSGLNHSPRAGTREPTRTGATTPQTGHGLQCAETPPVFSTKPRCRAHVGAVRSVTSRLGGCPHSRTRLSTITGVLSWLCMPAQIQVSSAGSERAARIKQSAAAR